MQDQMEKKRIISGMSVILGQFLSIPLLGFIYRTPISKRSTAFPPFKSMKVLYPVLSKKLGFFLTPFCYLHRIGRLLCKDRKFTKKRLSYMKKKNTNE